MNQRSVFSQNPTKTFFRASPDVSNSKLCNPANLEVDAWREDDYLKHGMIGSSPQMMAVYDLLRRAAGTDSTVLIQGESGTGKELAARALHRNGPRSQRPFVAISCAAIPEGLLESELFGHEKGAFTGAYSRRQGRLEIASGGTVFLDEIGELAPGLQVKLLRVLQERCFERVGGADLVTVDIRLLAATNRDLARDVKSGCFRKDLFYRLHVVGLTMPPLRERRADIPALTDFLVAKHEKRCKLRGRKFSTQAMAALTSYDWPGNVRELENVIERAVVLSSSLQLNVVDLPECATTNQPSVRGSRRYHDALAEAKRELIMAAMEECNGNYTRAALLLGLHPNYLHRLIRKMGLKSAISLQERQVHSSQMSPSVQVRAS